MVSVIIPNYNSERTIRKCLDSIKFQSYVDVEIIIIDDNSTDNCIEIINEFSDLNIVLIRNSHNFGPGYCRNVGLKMASGNYIAFLDSDDYWRYNHLEIIIEQFDLYRNKMFLFSRVLVDRNGLFCKRFQLKVVSQKTLLLTTPIVTSSVIIRRELICGMEFKDVVYDDLLFWYDCLERCGKAYMVDHYGAYYRITKNSYSSDKLKSSFEVFKMFLKNFDLNLIQAVLFFISYIVIGIYKQILQYFEIRDLDL